MELMFLHWLNLMNIRLGFYMERESNRKGNKYDEISDQSKREMAN